MQRKYLCVSLWFSKHVKAVLKTLPKELTCCNHILGDVLVETCVLFCLKRALTLLTNSIRCGRAFCLGPGEREDSRWKALPLELSQHTTYLRIYIYSIYADELEAESDDDPLSSDDALHARRAALDNSARSAGRHLLQMRLWVHASGTVFKSVLGHVP
jgi:hypothetical protein